MEVKCGFCESTGLGNSKTCRRCGGLGNTKCPACHGAGKTSRACLKCHGAGTVNLPIVKNSFRTYHVGWGDPSDGEGPYVPLSSTVADTLLRRAAYGNRYWGAPEPPKYAEIIERDRSGRVDYFIHIYRVSADDFIAVRYNPNPDDEYMQDAGPELMAAAGQQD
jgi:hypothetical protein